MVDKDKINFWNYRYGDINNSSVHSSQNSSISTCFLQNITKEFDDVLSAHKSIIELGCGTGEMSVSIKDKYKNLESVLATDIVENSINFCKARYDTVMFEVYNILQDDNILNTYDITICSNVIEHFKNPYIMIDKMVQISKYAIILVPYGEDVSAFDQYYIEDGGEPHVFSFNEESFEKYNIINSFKFQSPYWFGPNSDHQLAVLLKGNL